MFQVSHKIMHNMLNSFALGYGFKSMYVSYLANTLLVIDKKSGRNSMWSINQNIHSLEMGFRVLDIFIVYFAARKEIFT